MLIASGCYVTLYLFKPLSVVFGMNSPLQTHEWNTCDCGAVQLRWISTVCKK